MWVEARSAPVAVGKGGRGVFFFAVDDAASTESDRVEFDNVVLSQEIAEKVSLAAQVRLPAGPAFQEVVGYALSPLPPIPRDPLGQPVSPGNMAGGELHLRAAFPEYEGLVDIYLAISSPYGFFSFGENNAFMLGLALWRTSVTGPIEETLLPAMPIQDPAGQWTLALGDYTFYSIVVPAGTDIAGIGLADPFDLVSVPVTLR